MAAPVTDERSDLHLDGVSISAERVAEVEDGRVMVYVALGGVQRMTLRRTFRSAHPFLQFAVGLILTAVGVPALLHLAYWMFWRGGTVVDLEAWLVSFAVIGIWLTTTAFRRGYVIDVASSEGRKRLEFRRRTTVDQIRAFLDQARQRFGLKVEDELPAQE